MESSVKNVLEAFSKVNTSSKPLNPTNPIEPSNPSNPSVLKYRDGIYKGVGGGFYNTDSNRRMEVEITIKDDKIRDFKLLNFGDDNSFKDGYEKFEKKFLPKIKSDIGQVFKIYNSIVNWLEKKLTDYIDVATGATYSNKGVMLAIKDVLQQAEKANEGNVQNKVKDLIFLKMELLTVKI